MFDKQEVQFLEKMFAKVVTETTKNMVTKDEFAKAMKNVVTKDVLRGELDDVKVEMRDEIHSCIAASEHRMMKRMDQIIDSAKEDLVTRMDDMKEEILDGVSDIIGDRIVPQIDDHDIRITRLERRVAS